MRTYSVVVEQTPFAPSGGCQGTVGEGAVGELGDDTSGTPEGRTPRDQHEESVREHGDQQRQQSALRDRAGGILQPRTLLVFYPTILAVYLYL